MSEGTQYGMDDGVYRLRLTTTPILQREVVTTRSERDARTNKDEDADAGDVAVHRHRRARLAEDRTTLVLKAPGYATLLASHEIPRARDVRPREAELERLDGLSDQ